MRAARLAFLLLTSAWAVVLLATPVVAFGAPASGVVYAFSSLVCHQRPERSFHIDAAQLPVCARCFGIYAGAALGALAVAGLKASATAEKWAGLSGLRTMLIIAAVPTAITWASEVLGFWMAANHTRFVAALPLGAAVALTVNYLECVRPQQTGPSSPRIPT